MRRPLMGKYLLERLVICLYIPGININYLAVVLGPTTVSPKDDRGSDSYQPTGGIANRPPVSLTNSALPHLQYQRCTLAVQIYMRVLSLR